MLADDIRWALPTLRAEADSRMLDTFEVRVYAEGWVFNDFSGEDERAYEVLFTTPGRVSVAGISTAREVEVGGRTAAEAHRILSIPVGSDLVPADAVAVCTDVDETSDPTLLGAQLRIIGPAPGSQTTARRLLVEEVLS